MLFFPAAAAAAAATAAAATAAAATAAAATVLLATAAHQVATAVLLLCYRCCHGVACNCCNPGDGIAVGNDKCWWQVVLWSIQPSDTSLLLQLLQLLYPRW